MPSESHTGDQEAQGATCPRRAGCLRWCRPGRRGAAYAARRRTAGPGRPGDRRPELTGPLAHRLPERAAIAEPADPGTDTGRLIEAASAGQLAVRLFAV